MDERRFQMVFFCALCAMELSGCVTYARADAAIDGRFASLWNRQLSHFEQQLAVEHHTGAADAWTAVGEAWLRYANCEEQDRDAVQELAATDALASFAYVTVLAEDMRRRLLIYEAASKKARLDPDLLLVDVSRAEFFDRTPAELDPDLIHWTAAEEGWVDEVPARVAVESECSELRERVLSTTVDDEDDSSIRSYEDWLVVYFDAAETVSELFGELPEETRSGTPARVEWETRFHVARVSHDAAAAWRSFAERAGAEAGEGRGAENNLERAAEARDRYAELRSRSRQLLESLVESTPAELASTDAARARLLLASYEVDDNRPARALALLAEARELGLDEENFWAARYLEVRLLADAARWSDAAELADGLPPRASRYHGPYYYRVALALKRTDQEDRFLNVAMKAFRDRPYKADPFLRALYWEMLQTLAEYPFEERVVEMLEEMGARGGTVERVEEYARTALDRARPENARAAASWLLGRHHDARYHPRYHGIAALAAFIDDDAESFRASMQSIAQRPSAVVGALPSHRRPTFFAHADAELARVLRQMLPVMAEWGEGPAARDRRQKWLRVIVEQSQQFMRGADDTLARPQLVELYRLASALLDDHPRGYAERVGEEEPTPMVLGTVRVEGRDLEQFEPDVRVIMPEPYSLTVIPRDELPATRWPTRWPVRKGQENR